MMKINLLAGVGAFALANVVPSIAAAEEAEDIISRLGTVTVTAQKA